MAYNTRLPCTGALFGTGYRKLKKKKAKNAPYSRETVFNATGVRATLHSSKHRPKPPDGKIGQHSSSRGRPYNCYVTGRSRMDCFLSCYQLQLSQIETNDSSLSATSCATQMNYVCTNIANVSVFFFFFISLQPEIALHIAFKSVLRIQLDCHPASE